MSRTCCLGGLCLMWRGPHFYEQASIRGVIQYREVAYFVFCPCCPLAGVYGQLGGDKDTWNTVRMACRHRRGWRVVCLADGRTVSYFFKLLIRCRELGRGVYKMLREDLRV